MSLKIDELVNAKTSLLEFIKIMYEKELKTEFIIKPHHKFLSYVLEQVLAGVYKRLIINLPPRYSKTEMAVINFVAWAIGHYPSCEFIHASYSKRLATNNSFKIKNLVVTETYQELFPDMKLRDDSKAKDEWRTTAGGVVYATGSEGTITGYGAGKKSKKSGTFGGAVIIDDPHKPIDVFSDIKRNNVLDWYNNTLRSRLNSPDTPIIIIMQRLHENDLTGYLLNNSGDIWESIVIPAIDEEGNVLWEEMHDKSSLEKLRKANEYVFQSQYQQSPFHIGGSIFKEHWWQFYDELPNLEYRVVVGDTAQKIKEHNDYTVFQCWGLGRDGKAYLIEQVRGKWEAPELREEFVRFWQVCKSANTNNYGTLRKAFIEDKASGTGLIQDIKRSQSIPIVAVQRNKDKYTRVMDIVGYVQSGSVMLPNSKSWVDDYIAEHTRFTKVMVHKHDDQVDCTCDAVSNLLSKSSYEMTW